jgi:hypothetical protein
MVTTERLFQDPGGTPGLCCAVLYGTVFGGQVGWRVRPLILSLAADSAEELKKWRGRRGEEPEKRRGEVTTNGILQGGNVSSVCWGYEQGLRDVSCLGRS